MEIKSSILLCPNCTLRFDWQKLPQESQDLASAQCPRCNQRVEKPASCGQTGACFSCSFAETASRSPCHEEIDNGLNLFINLKKKDEISWQKRVRKTWENFLLKIQSITFKKGF